MSIADRGATRAFFASYYYRPGIGLGRSASPSS
jgi:hypothetical protein